MTIAVFSQVSASLNTFYVADIKSIVVLAYAAWYNLKSHTDKARLEKFQRSATRIILPFSNDNVRRPDNLALSTILTFLNITCDEHFTKKAYDYHHPLITRINVNAIRPTTACGAKIDTYQRSRCRATKRQNTCFEFYAQFYI